MSLSKKYDRVSRYQRCVFFFVFIIFSSISYSEPIHVSGWPLEKLDKELRPPRWLSNDPVFGRLVCPAFTRLHLSKEKSESLVLSQIKIKEAHDSSKKNYTWKWKVRKGLYWWDGTSVTAKDTKEFFKRNIIRVVEEKSFGRWRVPLFKVKIKKDQVFVRWADKPVFGPFVFNGQPFFKTKQSHSVAKGFSYQCAGVYIPNKEKGRFLLEPNKRYGQGHQPIILSKKKPTLSPSASSGFSFTRPHELPLLSQKDSPLVKSSKDKRFVALPSFTVAFWNLKRPLMKELSFRKFLDSLIPREYLIQHAAAGLGVLNHSLVPSLHPSFSSFDKNAHPFRFAVADKALDGLGYQLDLRSGKRRMASGMPLKLVVGTSEEDPFVVKVFVDHLRVLGIQVDVVYKVDFQETFDVYITGIEVIDRSADLLSFVADTKSTFSSLPLDASLQEEIESYSYSSTFQKPDFKLLRQIHKELDEKFFWSVVMQHGIYFHQGSSVNRSYKHPDWFKELLTKKTTSLYMKKQKKKGLKS